MKTPFLIACLIPVVSPAQVFQFEQGVSAGFTGPSAYNASLSGTVAIPPGQGTVEINGNLSSDPFDVTRSITRNITTGTFPNVVFYEQELSYTLSSAGLNESFSVGPVVPTFFQGTTYKVAVGEVFSAVIDVSYTMTENGLSVGGGAGSYTVLGGPPNVALDVGGFPNALGVKFDPFLMNVSVRNIPDAHFPHGSDLAVPAGAVLVVPEPGEWTAMAGLGLLGLAIARRFRR